MRKGIESWNLEIVSQLDLRAFNEEDLPEGLDRTGTPEFIRLASKPVEISLRKLLPPSTSFDCEDMRNSPSIVNISPPIPYNIEAFVVGFSWNASSLIGSVDEVFVVPELMYLSGWKFNICKYGINSYSSRGDRD